MSLDERIAKRKAEGWTLSHWHVRRGNGIYSGVDSYCDGTPRARTLKHRYETHQDALLDASKLGVGAVAIPVFARTIKVKRARANDDEEHREIMRRLVNETARSLK